ncbi:alkene reductase [Nocardia sp. NPDC023988]|uniref:alkene reductase n=1 Tax=unclassified Nocardia TaxID=2637762 RepID=UPI0033C42B1F
MTNLWTPTTVGNMLLEHRVTLSPMTRGRALDDGTPSPMTARYYAQRASLGMLVTEGTQPSATGQGYLNTPGIHTQAHVDGWRAVADAVHEAGAYLVIQLMHTGRMGHPDNTPGRHTPVGPSAIAPGVDIFTPTGPQPVPVPRELTQPEIEGIVGEFADAAWMAVQAGADAVEIHAANGYLLHQFLAPSANHRTDHYGGSIPNRARLTFQVAEAVADMVGENRTGIRISPANSLGGIDEGPDSAALYQHLVTGLAELDLAFLDVFSFADDSVLRDIRDRWHRPLLLTRAGRTLDRLGADIDAGLADLAPVGTAALANPDLVERLRGGSPLNTPDPRTFYSGGAEGYLDYPTLRAPAH